MNIVKQGIELIETKDFEELSRISAEVMVECILKKPDSLFCLATGSSPTRAYEIFVEIVNKETNQCAKITYFKIR